jgi:hypothetical protein
MGICGGRQFDYSACEAPAGSMIKQEAMKPGEKILFMAFWLLNLSLHFSGFHGFLLKL